MPPAPNGDVFISCFAYLGPFRPVEIKGFQDSDVMVFDAIAFFETLDDNEPFIRCILRYDNTKRLANPEPGFVKVTIKVKRSLYMCLFVPYSCVFITGR